MGDRWIHVCLLITLTLILPFALSLGADREWAGTDDQAVEAINRIDPVYRPWIGSIYEPDETLEGRLFLLQATVGASLLGYSLYRLRQLRYRKMANETDRH
ncbi:MAG: energy-coupling factor ABC transporter substrate-binding protein [Acidobacteriota bacterium]